MENYGNNVLTRKIFDSYEIYPWIVCFSASLFFFYEFVQINMFNAISVELMKDLNLTATQLGNLSACYLYSTVLFLFPIGIMLDKYSTKILLSSAMLICIGCTSLFALSHSLLMAEIFRFVGGGAGAFCFLSTLMLATRWFPPQRLALVTGLIVTIAMIGGVIAQTPLTYLVDKFGWRHALLFNASLGLFFLMIILTFVDDYPLGYSQEKHHKRYALGFLRSIKMAVVNYQNWSCALYTCLLNLLILLLGAVWGIGYLETVHHLSRTQASYITSMIFIGTIVGSPIMGWISDHIKSRTLPMILGALFSLITVLPVLFIRPLPFNTLIVLFFILGLFTSTQILSYPTIAESNPRELTGAAEGIACAVIMSGGAIFQPLFGWLMDLNWTGSLLHNTRIYSAHAYNVAIIILPIAFTISLLLAFCIHETNCKNNYKGVPGE